MEYYLNPRTQVLLLQILSLIFIFIIILMISYHSMETNALKQEIDSIEIPTCPACPACPACPNCPSQTVNTNTEDMKDKINLECPACPECPQQDMGQYPSVEDIVSGIFPGRNMGLTRGGMYQTLDASGSYELLPEYDFYKPEDAFPEDTILSRAVGDIEKEKMIFDNSYDNMNIDTRMNTGMNGLGEDSLQGSINRAREGELREPIDSDNSGEVLMGEPTEGTDTDLPIVEAQVVSP